MLRERNLQPRRLYPARLFKIEGEIKSFQSKQKLKVFRTPLNWLYKKVLKDPFHAGKTITINKKTQGVGEKSHP